MLGDQRGGEHVRSYAAPGPATDRSNLPPTFIDVTSAEVFRVEAIAYAGMIRPSGGTAERHLWFGGFHGFDLMAPHAVRSQAMTRLVRLGRAGQLTTQHRRRPPGRSTTRPLIARHMRDTSPPHRGAA